MTDIALAKKQRVFAVAETTKGTLVFPTTSDFIRPAGDATVNQSPTFNDSEEKQNTLDVLDQFQGSMPAGDFTVPTYLRPGTSVGGTPQGDPLWVSLQGTLEQSTTATLNGNISAVDTQLVVDDRNGGVFPEKGMIQVSTAASAETIYYSGITRTSRTATTATLTGLSRGQNGTSAGTHSDDAAVSLVSKFYKQATSSSSFSLWLETDHFVQGLSGCSVNQAVISINNDGPVTVNFTGQGMEMVWAGKDSLTSDQANAHTVLEINDAQRFSVGAYVYNATTGDDNTNSGYEIAAVDSSSASNTITITPGIQAAAGWSANDDIQGYLPDGASVLGTPVEGGDTTIEIAGVSATIRPSELTIGAPKQYVTDEVGTDYPEDYIEDTRSITAGYNLYFRKEDAKYFTQGYAGTNVTALFTLDDSDGEHRVDMYMKKCKLSVPDVTPEAPAVALNMTLTALGTDGEDSLEVTFN